MTSALFAPTQAAPSRTPRQGDAAQVQLEPFDPSGFQEGSRTWQRWSGLLRNAPHSSGLLHSPELIRYELQRASQQRPRPAFLVTQTATPVAGTPAAGRPTADNTAVPVSCVLLPHDIRTNDPSLGQIGPCWILDGYRLAGGQLLGGQRPADWSRFLDALFRTLPDLVLWIDDVEQNTPLAQLLSGPVMNRSFRVFSSRIETRSRIQIPENEQDYWNALSKNTRKDIRSTLKQGKDLRIQCFADPNSIPEFLVDAATVSEYSWQGQAGKPPIRDTVAELQRFQAVADQRALRAYVLYDRDQPIAFEVDYLLPDRLLGLECAYDLRHRDRAPGKVLQLLVLQDVLNTRSVSSYDFGNGDMFYKRRLANSTSSSGDVVLLSRNWRGNCLAGYLAASAGTHQLSRSVLQKLGVLDVLRRLKRSRKFAAADSTGGDS